MRTIFLIIISLHFLLNVYYHFIPTDMPVPGYWGFIFLDCQTPRFPRVLVNTDVSALTSRVRVSTFPAGASSVSFSLLSPRGFRTAQDCGGTVTRVSTVTCSVRMVVGNPQGLPRTRFPARDIAVYTYTDQRVPGTRSVETIWGDFSDADGGARGTRAPRTTWGLRVK